MDLAQMHDALHAAYAEVLEDPRNQAEALDGAACGPHMKHLAVLAAGAAAEGVSADQWHANVLRQAGPDAAAALDVAEECMRYSGLWPWSP